MLTTRREMSSVDFIYELIGFVRKEDAVNIYRMISHYPESKKNIVLDTLKSNPKKYVKYYLQDDI